MRISSALEELSLNAPFGARCFLTPENICPYTARLNGVLMHLMVLGVF